MTADFATVEQLAADLCHRAGGNWEAKRTKRNLWRKRVMALMALADMSLTKGAALFRAQRVMRGGK